MELISPTFSNGMQTFTCCCKVITCKELTWNYGIDFSNISNGMQTFTCCCDPIKVMEYSCMCKRNPCNLWCYNPSLGLTTKARAGKGAGQEWSPEITFHVLGSVGKCEGMNLHTPKWTLTLGVGVPMDSRIFRGWLQRSKLIGLKSFIYCWKALGT